MTLTISLTRHTPATLRRLLVAPDPVDLHDWNLTPDAYKAAVRDALAKQQEEWT
jgi:hypothetical protein